MKVLVVSIGSAGDVHPSVAVALALRDRGHSVSFATNPYFAPLLERVGLPLLPIGTVEEFDATTGDPALWNQLRSMGVLGRMVGLVTPEVYRLVEREAAAGDTVVVAHPLAFGARLVQEKLGVPLVSLHLAPSTFWSVDAAPVPSQGLASINAWPRALRRSLLAFGDRYLDRALAPALNRFRAELGLAPVRHIASRWWHSPQRTIGLFPDWFAAPQADWPARTALTGFPLYDERGVSSVPPGLEAFLAAAEGAGERPVVFVPGSANRQAGRFFAAAVDACRRLGRRGVLLTRYPEQLPEQLPDSVRHAEYAPLSAVLPRAAALVHHGGIGTTAQALAAGRPQLVMPMAFDQPDNAARLVRLGVARTVHPALFSGARVARHLAALLGSNEVAQRCADVARRFDHAEPLRATCDLIEACARPHAG